MIWVLVDPSWRVKLNFLASTLAPDYGTGGRMRGNYIKLTMGDYMDRVPGFLNSLSIVNNPAFPLLSSYSYNYFEFKPLFIPRFY